MTVIKQHAQESAEALRASLHLLMSDLTAPEVAEVLGEAKQLYWMFPDLLERLADQTTERSARGGLRDDRGPDQDPTTTALEASIALRAAAEAIRATGRDLEDAHNALSHLGDDTDR